MQAARVLVVCTANVCRSPMGAALLQQSFDRQGKQVIVSSAGTHSVKIGVDAKAVAVMAEFGVDISRHVPRVATRPVVEDAGADLVLTMTRTQLRDIAVLDRSAFVRAFTFREAARRAALGVRARAGSHAKSGQPALRSWTDELTLDRSPRDLLQEDLNDDIADPFGLSINEVRRTAAELEHLARVLVEAGPWVSASRADSVQS